VSLPVILRPEANADIQATHDESGSRAGCPARPPHHLACGSALGGSTKRSKLSPERLQAEKSLGVQPGVGQADAHGDGLGHVPKGLSDSARDGWLAAEERPDE
jgi:hypothetical protein